MDTALLSKFEQAVVAYNPILANKLQPGLAETRIRRALGRAKVSGDLDPVIALYTWKDGTILDSELVQSKKGFFPGKPYYFICLEMAIGHFGSFREIAKNKPKIGEAVGRYFPVFWSGSTSWLAIDVQPSNRNRVMTIDFRSEQPICKAFESFHDFLTEAIRASEQGDALAYS